MEYPGRVIDGNNIHLLNEKVIEDASEPKSVSELKSFLAQINPSLTIQEEQDLADFHQASRIGYGKTKKEMVQKPFYYLGFIYRKKTIPSVKRLMERYYGLDLGLIRSGCPIMLLVHFKNLG